MATGQRVGKWALASLGVALVVALAGKTLDWSGKAPWLGGLLFAFGEAALVGGLADWFAVRALFGHPLGIPLPHTALIPRNRQRIIQEIRQLVQNEWLPPSLLKAKVKHFDFLERGLLPLVETLKPHLAEVLRSAGRDILEDISPHEVARFLGRGLAGSLDADRIGPFLGDLTRRAREQRWLEPVVREWVQKVHQWASSAHSREILERHLTQAARSYQDHGWFKRLTFNLAERMGGIDLAVAAADLQTEIQRFAAEQLSADSQLDSILRDGLASIERRLHEDPRFLEDVRSFILQTAETGTLTTLLEPVLQSLREQGRRELEGEDSRFLTAALYQLDQWVARVRNDPGLREQINQWCRKLAVQLVEEHHSLVGALVEEQLDRLSEKHLTELIQARVGEDLNWIRINGSLVGGLVGVLLYLVFGLIQFAVR
jgi:uncharacterized membrane-anchored protein YjiN (DUF445 family)